MAEIITLNEARSARAERRAPRQQGAEIILFPGVFYEYLDASAFRQNAGLRSRKTACRPKRKGRGRSSSRTS